MGNKKVNRNQHHLAGNLLHGREISETKTFSKYSGKKEIQKKYSDRQLLRLKQQWKSNIEGKILWPHEVLFEISRRILRSAQSGLQKLIAKIQYWLHGKSYCSKHQRLSSYSNKSITKKRGKSNGK